MHHAALREALRKQPFVPFRLVLSNGSQYDVRSPEWMLVTGMWTMLGIPGEAPVPEGLGGNGACA